MSSEASPHPDPLPFGEREPSASEVGEELRRPGACEVHP